MPKGAEEGLTEEVLLGQKEGTHRNSKEMEGTRTVENGIVLGKDPTVIFYCGTSLMARTVRKLPAMQETQVQSLVWEDPLEKCMATHSSILAWRIPWTEDPGGLQSMGSQRVRHNQATTTSLQG